MPGIDMLARHLGFSPDPSQPDTGIEPVINSNFCNHPDTVRFGKLVRRYPFKNNLLS